MNPNDLFNAYLDGELSEEEFQTLELWIASDKSNAAQFMEWMALQSLTREAIKGDLLEQVLREPMPRGGIHPRVVTPSWLVGLAASLVIAAFAYWLGGRPAAPHQLAQVESQQPEVQEAPAGPLRPAQRLIVATLTRLENCVWKGDGPRFRYGQPLREGARLSLHSGTIRITFESGAEATLLGPCDFTVDNAMRGTIHAGRVAVTAPKRAYGFRIRSPNAEVIDLGTEFGVSVDEGGNSEVHVFSGEVLSRGVREQDQSSGELFRVTANNALEFAGEENAPRRMESNNSLFARTAQAVVKPKTSSALPTDGKLALWLAADASVRTQEGRRVVAWSDILHADNETAEDALQPAPEAQPILAPKGINGRPAVRFNGNSSYLVTTPLETTDDQTIFVVCQFNKGAVRPNRKRGGQILNYNGPPHRLVSSSYEPGVLQIGESVVAGYTPTGLGGKLFAGRLNGKDVSESEMYAEPIGVGVPVVLAYRYDLANHKASLWLNGQLVEEKPALRPAGVTSRKTIGRHGFMKFFFGGEIGELMIFNSALNDADLQQVAKYLGDKFEIPLKNPAPTT